MFNIFKDRDFIQCKFFSEKIYVSKLIIQVREFLKQYEIIDDAGIILVLRELVNNAIEHGNRKIRELKIFASIEKIGNRRFKIRVEDEGSGFDYQKSDLMFPDNPALVQKRGLSLVNSFSDQLDFNNKGNCITAYVSIKKETEFSVKSWENNEGVQWQIIIPTGDITSENAEKFRYVLVNLFSTGFRRYRFDLSKVRDIDSLGLSIFVVFSNMLRERDRKNNDETCLEILNANRGVINLFGVTRLDKIYRIRA